MTSGPGEKEKEQDQACMGAQNLTRENLEIVWAEFSTLS
jgi:hypothetical protein